MVPPKQAVSGEGRDGKNLGQGRERRPRDRLAETTSPPASTISEGRRSRSTVDTWQTRDARSTKSGAGSLGPRDSTFRHNILRPRGIVIDDTARSVAGPHIHFGTSEDVNYRSQPGLEDLTIWLEKDEGFIDRIEREYDCMEQQHLCEAEFASFAKENLLSREPRQRKLPPGDRRPRPERMLELVAKPGSKAFWEPPPSLTDEPGAHYAFDLRPDVSYWLSLQAFNRDYVGQVEEYVLVVNKTITCPYFTVEFKKDDRELIAAINQVAAAGALALYNRYLLKKTRVEDRSTRAWRPGDLRRLTHYTLTFTGARYTFWRLRPDVDLTNGQWKGCKMERVFQNSADTAKGVSSLIDWLNAIHFWGLSEYGPSCQADIKRCLNDSGFRVSYVGDRGGVEEDSEGGEE